MDKLEEYLHNKYKEVSVQYERLNIYYIENKDLPEEAKNTTIYQNNRATGLALLYQKRMIEEIFNILNIDIIK